MNHFYVKAEWSVFPLPHHTIRNCTQICCEYSNQQLSLCPSFQNLLSLKSVSQCLGVSTPESYTVVGCCCLLELLLFFKKIILCDFKNSSSNLLFFSSAFQNLTRKQKILSFLKYIFDLITGSIYFQVLLNSPMLEHGIHKTTKELL